MNEKIRMKSKSSKRSERLKHFNRFNQCKSRKTNPVRLGKLFSRGKNS
jgi:hypothetical protein